MSRRVRDLDAKAEALKKGDAVNGFALPWSIQDFYGKADKPWGYNKREGDFLTAGPNWNYPKSERLTMSSEVEEVFTTRPSKFQSLILDGKFAAFIHNTKTSFLNDANAYVTWVNLEAVSKDDPWDEGCTKISEALDAVITDERNDVEDSDAGATIAYFKEENLLKAVDTLVERFGEKVLYSHKEVA